MISVMCCTGTGRFMMWGLFVLLEECRGTYSYPFSILKPHLHWFQLILAIVGGDFWLIIGTFLSHYQDNLPDKRNREFANAPSHTSMPLWPNYCCWPNYWGWGGGGQLLTRNCHKSDAGSNISMPSWTVETNQNARRSRQFTTKPRGFSLHNFFG